MAKVLQIIDVDSEGHKVRLDDGRVIRMPHGGPPPHIGHDVTEPETDEVAEVETDDTATPIDFGPELIERLAEAAHDVWMEGKIRDGWEFAPETDKANKKHACLIPYTVLSESDKQSDRDLAIGIPVILEKAGFFIVLAKQ